MNINLTLLMQAVAFFAFILFTAKFVWPPLMRAIETRQKQIADGLAAGGRASCLSLSPATRTTPTAAPPMTMRPNIASRTTSVVCDHHTRPPSWRNATPSSNLSVAPICASGTSTLIHLPASGRLRTSVT